MKKLFTILTVVVALCLAGVLAVALVPSLSVDEALLTPESASVSPATYSERDDGDLRRAATRTVYTPPLIAGAETHSLLNGLRPTDWVGFAPGEAEGPRPMVILFAGANRSAMSMIDMWQATARENGLVLVAIEGDTSSGRDPEPVFINRLLDAALDRYDVDRSRIYLFGHSAGAVRAQVIANRVVGPWRAVAVHAGYPSPDWVHAVEGGAPVRHYLGTSDAIFNPASARSVGQYLAFNGHPFELVLIPGHTHWFYDIGPVIAADAWDWFESLEDTEAVADAQ
ncbi:hypothetical protein HKCCE2091_00560 [Rhodobacterales bacterium HKCCE2091]|nr:hypothetical protein [Rhodobacterales bacterium HKCCE2091]